MAFKSFNIKLGRLRLYSGNTPNKFWFEVPFRGNVVGPVDRPRPAENIVLDRGRGTADAHYTQGPDDVIYQPLPLTFNFRLANSEPNFLKLLQVIRAPGGTAQKTIGGWAWTTTKGTSQLRNAVPAGTGAGQELHTTPGFTDPEKWCCDVEVLWEDPDNQNDRGVRWQEVHFPPDRQVTEGDADVMVDMAGEVYGAITLITAFTAGSEK